MLPLLLVAASPVIATYIFKAGTPNYSSHYQLIAQAVERAWHDGTKRPLRIVGSYTDVVNGVIPYFMREPTAYDILTPKLTPWIEDKRIARDGLALVCPMPESHCIGAQAQLAGCENDRGRDHRTYRGTAGPPVRYRIVVIPPAS